MSSTSSGTCRYESLQVHHQVLVVTSLFKYFIRYLSLRVFSLISGIFGNSVEEAIGASWEIKTSMRKGYAAAGIITEEDDLIDDYPYSRVTVD